VLFDVYRGKPLESSEKSLAWRLTFAGDDRTLTEAEVDDAVAAITAGLGVDVAGRLRT
jgi:phenylalanyl-tRNA synthetase beta subunit